jgi:hypothetical protein
MVCQCCGSHAETKYFSYHQNIGALVMRFSKSINANLCKSCSRKFFWQFTGTNLLLGWWGMISLIINPFLIINNVVYFLRTFGMADVRIAAEAVTSAQQELSSDVVARLNPYTQQIFQRLNNHESLPDVAFDTARLTQVTPNQVEQYIQSLIAANQKTP